MRSSSFARRGPTPLRYWASRSREDLRMLLGQNLPSERLDLEGHEVLDPLSHAEELHREIELFLQGHHDAATRGAVHLRQDESGQVEGLAERPDLRHGVLADSSVQDQ